MPLQRPPPNKKKHLMVEAVVWLVETHNIPFSPFIVEWLVWLQASGFWYTTDNRLLLGLLLSFLLFSYVMEILLF